LVTPGFMHVGITYENGTVKYCGLCISKFPVS